MEVRTSIRVCDEPARLCFFSSLQLPAASGEQQKPETKSASINRRAWEGMRTRVRPRQSGVMIRPWGTHLHSFTPSSPHASTTPSTTLLPHTTGLAACSMQQRRYSCAMHPCAVAAVPQHVATRRRMQLSWTSEGFAVRNRKTCRQQYAGQAQPRTNCG